MYSFGLEGIEKYKQDIADIQSRTQQLSPISSQIHQVFLEDLQERFMSAPRKETGGYVHGGAYWHGSKSYSSKNNNENKIPERGSGRILVDAEEFVNSLTVEGDGNNIFEVNIGERDDEKRSRMT